MDVNVDEDRASLLYVKGASLSGSLNQTKLKYRLHTMSFLVPRCREDACNSTTLTKRNTKRTCVGRTWDTEGSRTCRSVQELIVSQENRVPLRRSKSDISLKSGFRIPSYYDRDKERRLFSSSLKRKESFTRRDIMNKQCDSGSEPVKHTGKFKLDVKVGVKNDHYNKWARNKANLSVGSTRVVNNQASKSDTSKTVDRLKKKSTSSQKGQIKSTECSSTDHLLHFENFDKVVKAMPTRCFRGAPEVPERVKNDATDIRRAEDDKCNKREITTVSLKLPENIHVCKEPSGVSRLDSLSVNNPQERPHHTVYATSKRTFIKQQNQTENRSSDDKASTALSRLQIATSLQENMRRENDRSSEIEAVLKTNSSNVNTPLSNECDDLRKKLEIPEVIKETSTSEEGNGSFSSIGSNDETEKDNEVSTAKCKVSLISTSSQNNLLLIPMTKDSYLNNELETKTFVPSVIRNNLPHLSNFGKRNNRSVNKTATRESSCDKANVQFLGDKCNGVVKVPLQLATTSPLFTAENVENDFLTLRIAQYLEHLKIRTENQTASNSLTIDDIPLSSRSRQYTNMYRENQRRYKQRNITLNDQVDFSQNKFKSEISATNVCIPRNNQTNTENRQREIIPFRRLSVKALI